MSKNKLAFVFLFALILGFLYTQKSKIDTDIFSLINQDKEQKEIFSSLQKSLSLELVFLVEGEDSADLFYQKLEKSQLFSKIYFKPSIKELANELKPALLAMQNKAFLELDASFFKKNAEDFFNPFAMRILPAKEDFFNLSATSNLLKNQSKIAFENGYLKSDGYVFLNATLKPNYDSMELLKLVIEAKNEAALNNSKILASGGAIYSALGQKSGNDESAIMGGGSLLLTALLLLFIFRKMQIFYLSLVAVFGLLCGLAGAFLLFSKVHILSIVLSTSLIGLMFDFALHWLSKGYKSGVSDIRTMKKVFILGLLITTSGYVSFLFAPLSLLKECAVFSIFALLGAFFATYFFLPSFLLNTNLKISPQASDMLDILEINIKKITANISKKSVTILGVFLFFSSVFLLPYVKFEDDVRAYSSTPKLWLLEAREIMEKTGVKQNFTFVVLDENGDEMALAKHLLDKKLIKDYFGISKIFLSEDEQKALKNTFAKFSENEQILGIYEDFGFEKASVRDEFLKLSQTEIFKPQALLQSEVFKEVGRYFTKDGKKIIYLDGVADALKIKEICKENNAVYMDFVTDLNENFSHTKHIAILLKIVAFLIAFAILSWFFGVKKAFFMLFLVLLSSLMTLGFFAILGHSVNMFAIFGLILASAVGIDYMIFAKNEELELKERMLGIILASATSIISFLFLSFSATAAISSFGLSVSICIFLCAVFALILSEIKI